MQIPQLEVVLELRFQRLVLAVVGHHDEQAGEKLLAAACHRFFLDLGESNFLVVNIDNPVVSVLFLEPDDCISLDPGMMASSTAVCVDSVISRGEQLVIFFHCIVFRLIRGR